MKHSVPKFAEYDSSLAQLLAGSPATSTEFNSARELVYILPSPPPPSSKNLQPLNLKTEVHRRKTFKYWRVPFMDVKQLAAAGFFFTNRVMWFVRFVEWKSGIGLKEMMHLRTISVGVHLERLLRGCL